MKTKKKRRQGPKRTTHEAVVSDEKIEVDCDNEKGKETLINELTLGLSGQNIMD